MLKLEMAEIEFLTGDISESLAPYSRVAAEYYDEARHPTCRNFRDASRFYLQRALLKTPVVETCLEVGAGQSLVADLVKLGVIRTEHLFLLDSSIEMRSYSKPFTDIADLVVGDACRLPFGNETISLIAASLADPFNVDTFWHETVRCLKTGGLCIVTIPSYEWASSFRSSSEDEFQGKAFFELSDGQRLYLPSNIQSEFAQKEMIAAAGLRIIDIRHLSAKEVPAPHSRKIFGCANIVTGYTATKMG
jgi:ubiquinone/menaquinone biosynthesis C-methylase UbiE